MWREPLRRTTKELRQDLLAHAEELVSAQDHVQGLLAAVVLLAEDLELEAVLNRVAGSACELTGARYASLGIYDEAQVLTHFITVGLEDEEIRLIGDRPAGKGLIGNLVSGTAPLRLHDLTQQSGFSGFPPHHPAMKTYLGIPIRAGGCAFGYLQLTEKEGGGDFTEEDEALCVALAAAAGIAIRNARLLEDSKRRQRWLEAGMDVSAQLMTARHAADADSLDLAVERAVELSGSAAGLIVRPDHGSEVVRCQTSVGVEVCRGGEDLPLSPVLAGVLRTGESAMVPTAEEVLGPDAAELLGPTLVTVVGQTGGGGDTLLVLARGRHAPQFPSSDLESSKVYGTRIALALELIRAHRLREEGVLVSDRERIALDLHDFVIQRIFAAGLSLQSLRRYFDGKEAHARIIGITEELDVTIAELRATIHSLARDAAATEPLARRIVQAIHICTREHSVTPRLQIVGPIDDKVPEAVAEGLLAVLHEGLTNAIRHSGADKITVVASVDDYHVQLVVIDNGSGIGTPRNRSGLSTMEYRATALGGRCTIEDPPGGGTRVIWTVPLS